MKACRLVNLGLTDYEKALAFQHDLFKKRHAGQIPDTLVLAEHPAVYTCGRSADAVSLIKNKLPENTKLIMVDRGGSITFHGPGQLMIYPIISLDAETNIISYLRHLEQVIIRSIAVYGIKATNSGPTGVWAGGKKLASIGIKVSSRITMHGIALNVNCDLDYFKPILACGLKSEATSMRQLLGYEVEMEDVADLIILNFGKMFNYRMREDSNELEHKIYTETKPNENYFAVKDIVRKENLHTVCEEAACPNKFECFGNKTAAFLILGKHCTRNCSFCLISEKNPELLDSSEPYRVAEAVAKMDLDYASVTSVSRDDLADGGAGCFAETIKCIRKLNPSCLIEVLTPDFKGSKTALKKVLKAEPEVFNHNIETVKRLYSEIRPQADYYRSLDILKFAKHYGLIVKSGIMVGLGEHQQEIIDTMHDIRAAGTDILTIGQYLRPTTAHHDVKRFYRLQEFSFLKQLGLAMNFKAVESMPLVRSSYKAYDSYNKVIEWQQKSKQAS